MSQTRMLILSLFLNCDAVSIHSNTFSLQPLAYFRDFPWEIPLAHCVRVGMVRTAGRGRRKKKGGGHGGVCILADTQTARRGLLHTHSRPSFSLFCSRMRCTIPPVTIGAGGISSVQQQTSRKPHERGLRNLILNSAFIIQHSKFSITTDAIFFENHIKHFDTQIVVSVCQIHDLKSIPYSARQVRSRKFPFFLRRGAQRAG